MLVACESCSVLQSVTPRTRPAQRQPSVMTPNASPHCWRTATMYPSADIPHQPAAAVHQMCRSDRCERDHGKVYTDDQGHRDDCQFHAVVSTTECISIHWLCSNICLFSFYSEVNTSESQLIHSSWVVQFAQSHTVQIFHFTVHFEFQQRHLQRSGFEYFELSNTQALSTWRESHDQWTDTKCQKCTTKTNIYSH